MSKIRLNKFLADCGVSSRRHADRLIEEGKVWVNGKKIQTLGVQINPLKDKVFCNKKPVVFQKNHLYFSFYKPKKVLSTLKDPENRRTIVDFFQDFSVRLFPVGRLDWDSEGLLLITNDGEFSQKVLHPRYKIPKTYFVKVKGHISKEKLEKLRRGVTISGKPVKALVAQKVRHLDTTQNPWVKVVILEGRNQQIRRMFEKINFHVIKLKRVAIGNLRLGSLKPGHFKALSKRDLQKIFTKTSFKTH